MVAAGPAPRYIRDVPKIIFEASLPERIKEATVLQGGALVDLADELRAAVPFSCRSATCGTCICQIIEGRHLLEEPNDDEAELLELMGGRSDTRLCCQARFMAGDGVVRLRALDAATSRSGDDD